MERETRFGPVFLKTGSKQETGGTEHILGFARRDILKSLLASAQRGLSLLKQLGYLKNEASPNELPMKKSLLSLALILLLFSCQRAEQQLVLTQTVREQLLEFKEKEKFAPAEWEKRGAVPPRKEVRQKLEAVVNQSIERILQAEQPLRQSQINTIVSAELNQIGLFELAPEEKKFLADTFHALSGLLQMKVDAVVLDELY